MRYDFLTLDVFTERRFCGNQLAVVPTADGLATEQMQAIAAEFGYSETVFVLPPASPAHAARVRIFTPRAEIPFAGHPTVGTALVLTWLGLVEPEGSIVLEEGAGPVPVELSTGSGVARAEFTAPRPPERGPAADPRRVADTLGLDVGDLVTAGGLPCDASAGLPFLFVELAGEAALARAAMRDRGEELSPASSSGLYLFVRDGREIKARMFGPCHGIVEDPATGSAAAALGGLLAAEPGRADGWHAWTIHQGREMGRPSRIEVRALRREGAATEVRVGGGAVQVMEGTIEVDP